MLQRQDLAAHPAVKRVLESPELFDLMENLMQVGYYGPFSTTLLLPPQCKLA